MDIRVFVDQFFFHLSEALGDWASTLYANGLYFQTEYSGETFHYSWGGLLLAFSDLIEALSKALRPKE